MFIRRQTVRIEIEQSTTIHSVTHREAISVELDELFWPRWSLAWLPSRILSLFLRPGILPSSGTRCSDAKPSLAHPQPASSPHKEEL